MKRSNLLTDQPADSSTDRLHFYRFLNAIEDKILNREETAPFVIGIYGKWGSGKSTLLRILAEKLKKEPERWEIVEFSPWMYRNEKSLLLPLLATLTKKRPVFEKLMKEVLKYGPKLIKTLSVMGFETATTGLPLLTFLNNIRKDKEKAKDLSEKIEEAIRVVTKNKKRMVFLIDDLDRCHDPALIIGLLEQIKLFLHIDHCIFFICVDRDKIIKAIDKLFPGEGEEYLDKFVQLPFELPPHHCHHLIDMLGIENKEAYRYFMRISEVLDHNPRKLKKLWNQAVIGLEVVKEEMDRVQSFIHEPSLELMLKWLLLKEYKPLKENPYLYLKYESQGSKLNQDSGNETLQKQNFLKDLGLKNKDGQWVSEFHRRFAVFLWHDSKLHSFKSHKILSLYAHASGEDISRSLAFIEQVWFDGKDTIEFEDFSWSNLSGGNFSGIEFRNCDFSSAVLKDSELNSTSFICCNLQGTCFDGTHIENSHWIECEHIDQLNTEPVLYEMIADCIVKGWREKDSQKQSSWNFDPLYKMYKTILDFHKDNKTLTKDIEQRLIEKGTAIRNEVQKKQGGVNP